MTKFYIYSDCGNYALPNAEAEAHYRMLTKKNDGSTGYYKIIDDQMSIEKVIETFVTPYLSDREDLYSLHDIDDVMGAMSKLMSGDSKYAVFETGDGSVLLSIEDQGPIITLTHEQRFASWKKYVPVSDDDWGFDRLLGKHGMGVLPVRKGDATEYRVYAWNRHVASTVLERRLEAEGSLETFRAFAKEGILIDEITEILGSDWTSTEPSPPPYIRV